MVKSEIERNGKWERPAYNYRENNTYEAATAQMSESIRNVLEGIANSQMLRCDVRDDIRRMRIAMEKIARGYRVRPKAKKGR